MARCYPSREAKQRAAGSPGFLPLARSQACSCMQLQGRGPSRAPAQPTAAGPAIDDDNIGGRVTSRFGPEQECG